MRKTKKVSPFRFVPFSLKQKKVLTWWMKGSPHEDKDAIICDGSVRAGKTLVMSLSYVIWAMENFSYQNLGMAGKTIGSFRRNVLFLLKIILAIRGYAVKDQRSDNMLVVTSKKTGNINYFYIFGGKDERSQDLVQGITCAGFFFDEVALMPESFVNQATARCSVDGSKFWFNCNPEGPYHWFNLEWIEKKKEKNALHIHFTMEDNPSLTTATKDRYRRMYSGVFFDRYILGLWVVASGIIYDMFDRKIHEVPTVERNYTEYYVAIDYGIQNPTTFGLWGKYKDKWYKVKEYYYSGKDEKKQKTDAEYYEDLEGFVKEIHTEGNYYMSKLNAVIIDPSAASFITLVKQQGKFQVMDADNDVLNGIRNVSTALKVGLLRYNDVCINTFKEFNSYAWDPKAQEKGEDKPIEKNDHCLDADRYFVNTVLFDGSEPIDSSTAELLSNAKVY